MAGAQSQMTAKGQKVKLVDVEKCIGCELCEKVCEFIQEEPLVRIYSSKEGILIPVTCLHCTNPVCIEVCPSGAIYQREDGAVGVRVNKCVGCRLCVIACPFGVPETDPAKGYMKKCELCVAREREGLAPACVELCPAGAIIYGVKEEVLKEAKGKTVDLLRKMKIIKDEK